MQEINNRLRIYKMKMIVYNNKNSWIEMNWKMLNYNQKKLKLILQKKNRKLNLWKS